MKNILNGLVYIWLSCPVLWTRPLALFAVYLLAYFFRSLVNRSRGVIFICIQWAIAFIQNCFHVRQFRVEGQTMALFSSIELTAFHWSITLTYLHLYVCFFSSCLYRHCQLRPKIHITCSLQPLHQVQECGMNSWSAETTSLSVLDTFFFLLVDSYLQYTALFVYSVCSVFIQHAMKS